MPNFTLDKIKKLPLKYIKKKKYYRIVSKKHENEVLDFEGSFLYGGRYNPIQEFGALYLGETLKVCRREKEIHTKSGNYLENQVAGEVEVSIKKVISLYDKESFKKLGITKKELIQNDGYDLTWKIARMAYNLGIKAILAPSRTSEGAMLVIFDKYVEKSHLKIRKKFSVNF